MIKIAVCDDEKVFVEHIMNLLKIYEEDNKSNIIYRGYLNGLELLEDIENFDLIFLDLEMPHIKGFEVAEIIREKEIPCEIVFLTSMKELGYKSYEYEAKNFIVKPMNYDLLKKIINDVLKVMKYKVENQMVFKLGKQKYRKLDYSEFTYVEARFGKCTVYAEDDTFKIDEKIKEIESRFIGLPLYKPHRSYLINLWMVDDYNNKEILLKSDVKIPLSRLKYPEFKEVYMNFLSNFGGVK